MTDKEQIIIDGVNIFETIDNWADLISQEWCSAEYLTAEIIKNHILGINKQLARKTQEYNELTLQIRETQEYSDTCAECKDDIFTNVKTSYSQIEVESRALAKIISSLKSKTQECEQKDERILELTRAYTELKEKFEALKLENQEGYEIVAELKHECEELKKEYEKQKNTWLKQSKVLFLKKKSIEALKKAVLLKENNRYIQSCLTQEKQLEYEKLLNKLTRDVVLPAIPEPEVINLTDRYRKAFEEIEKLAIKTNRNLCNNCGWVNTISCIPSEYICGDIKQILDIIRRAKGEGNE